MRISDWSSDVCSSDLGTGYNSYFDVPIPGVTYREFLFPGVLAITVLFITVFYGLYIVWDRKMDVLKAFIVAPPPRWGIDRKSDVEGKRVSRRVSRGGRRMLKKKKKIKRGLKYI